MKILHVVDNFSVHTYRILAYLSKTTQYEITVITNQPAQVIPEYIKQLPIKIIVNDLPFWYIQHTMVRPIMRVLRSIQTAWLIRKTFRSGGYDIVHTGWLQKQGFFAALACVHPMLMQTWGSDVLIYPFCSVIYKKIACFAARQADAIWSDAQCVKKTLLSFAPIDADRIQVFLQNGLDLHKYRNDKNLGSKIIEKYMLQHMKVLVMTRNLEPIYSVETLIKAMPIILEQYPACKALIVGTGSLFCVLQEQIKMLGLTKHMILVGEVPFSLIPCYLNAADLYVSCSQSDGSSSSLGEALACGLPCVVSDIPANHEWITEPDNGLFFTKNDHMALAGQIIRLLADDTVRAAIGQNNRRKASVSWDQDMVYSQLIKLYESLHKKK